MLKKNETILLIFEMSSTSNIKTFDDWYPLNIRHRSEEICKGINSRYKINKKTGVIQSNR